MQKYVKQELKRGEKCKNQNAWKITHDESGRTILRDSQRVGKWAKPLRTLKKHAKMDILF